jgi:hypothetical protein
MTVTVGHGVPSAQATFTANWVDNRACDAPLPVHQPIPCCCQSLGDAATLRRTQGRDGALGNATGVVRSKCLNPTAQGNVGCAFGQSHHIGRERQFKSAERVLASGWVVSFGLGG